MPPASPPAAQAPEAVKLAMPPHVLDDATIDRSKQVHTEQLEFVDIYAQQISRWRAPNGRQPVESANWTGWRRKPATARPDRAGPRAGSRTAKGYHQPHHGQERHRTRTSGAPRTPT